MFQEAFWEGAMKHKSLNRLTFPILGIIFALLLSGWTWDPVPALAIPTGGFWSGTTSRGYPMSFEVDSSATQWTNFKLKTNFNFGFCSGTVEITVYGPGAITNGQFSRSSSTFSFTGQFATTYTASGTYSFTNLYISGCSSYLTQSGTWTASFVPTTTFADVPLSHWAHDWIERLYNAGITGGCASNPLQYCPVTPVTRGQMAVFLLRGIHNSSYNPPTAAGNVFSDVPPSYWSAAWVEQLAAEGITSGCGTGVFCPESPVNRAQMAVFLLRAKYGAGYLPPEVGAGTGFNDVPADYWAAAWIKQLAAEGITSGCGTGVYCPETPVTRDQMAVFLVRTFSLP
jgi:hypothetical protein